MLSVPNGDELEAALDGLELSVGLDFYVTETTAHCDYMLPVTTMYERDDFALTFQQFQATPFRQATEAVVAPRRARRARSGTSSTTWHSRMGRRTPVFAVLAAMRKLAGPVRASLDAARRRRRR